MSPSQQLRDAAIVLNSLPDEMVSDVLSRLDDQSQHQLMDSMDSLESLNKISGQELHQISRRFREQTFGSAGHHRPASANLIESDVEPSVQPAARETFQYDETWLWPQDSLGPNTEPFAFLKYMDSRARRQLLETEHPLNVAMVMSSLSPEFASSITRDLDPAFRMSVIRRLCELDIIDDAKLMGLRYELRMRAKRMLAIEHCTKQGFAVAADLLSLSDRKTRDGVLAWLRDRDNELAEELTQRILTMNDIANFSDSQIAKLLKRVDTSAWAGALRSTLPSVAKRVLECMAPRAAYIVNAEMAAFNPLDEEAAHWSVEQVIGEAIKIRAEDSAVGESP
ncbi:FliG C-terminal domain-containing protein [Mariniblastus fucicola]|uniref:Flagellar motor switch protein FliG n=1 Tax=Mariniblastus fucicola TaxID=980251 RepID=A0A5B9PDM5_9BACT|nr:FliG C-terminal domain-containing protein [Mariniblastus fucicola]QEG23210.1 Flagellar motor switch protein FliG [Mariniblastus fucicola]